ncbi:SIMPL domain-containing protein [Erythrobacter oryzae]|uniref:SIMPL domain-containing protein n=1 Tax=Erythrobacter oryzae TaxID=3019556 RepID=UPI0025563412|nr:SIMPL domain-containing protein [Erythrobacter sp. COR-2]
MLKPVATLAAASALMLPAAAFAAPQVNLAPTGPVVELSIYESVDAAPDQATVSAGVTTTEPTATAAMRRNAEEMTKVIARIKALGIAEKDIQTTGVALGPQYDYQNGSPVFRGYQASNRVSVILRKIDDTGRVLDALVEAGATDIGGPSFAIADDTALKEQARKAAVARGAAQARAYAAMLGYADVRVLAVSEAIESMVPRYAEAKAMALEATATPIQPGQVATGVSVTITYELLGKAAPATK